MSDKSRIEWTDSTWNPVTGCSKVSQGCKHCYAERLWPKLEGARIHREGGEVRPFTHISIHTDRLTQPLKWTQGRRIFVNSLSDLFHERVPFQFIADVFAVMSCTTRHTYQVLTKRPQRMLEFFAWLDQDMDELFNWPNRVKPLRAWPDWTSHVPGKRGGYDNCGPLWPLKNVWLGVSVEDQATADERIPLLLQTPAAVRFLSCEPLLGPIDLAQKFLWTDMNNNVVDQTGHEKRLHWIIAGGESGPNARPSHPDWFRSLRDQCASANVPFFFKQWGEWAADECQGPDIWQHLRRPVARWLTDHFEIEAPAKWPDDANLLFKLGKKAAGRLLDNRTHDEYPA